MTSRCYIVVVDKNDNYSFLFNGFRKNKFIVSQFNSISKFSDFEFNNANLIFIVLYELIDVFELLQISNTNVPIIIASSNHRILNKVKFLKSYFVLDLSEKMNFKHQFISCINQIL